MKRHFYILLFFSFNLFSQNYNLIIKADKILNTNKPNLNKVEKILNKAEKRNYGFCGNAKESALSEIDYLRAKILFIQNEYEKCLIKLNSENIWIRQKSSDSLKIECLIKIHGKEKVKSVIFEKCNEKIVRNLNYLYTKISLKLENINYNFCFYDQDEKLDYKKELTILEILEETNFYNLLL
jgi:hypothetical protein